MGLLDIFRGHPNTINESFVESPMRDNWYQASSYFPSPFALITTVSETGETNIGPYQLTFPFEVIGGRIGNFKRLLVPNHLLNRLFGRFTIKHKSINRFEVVLFNTPKE